MTQSIKILAAGEINGTDLMALDATSKWYEDEHNVNVIIERKPDKGSTYSELIIAHAETGGTEYDGYVTHSGDVGEAVLAGGWMDLEKSEGWKLDDDLLKSIRENTAMYNETTYMIPFDGDAIYLYYRDDILKFFNQKAPRTWDEYTNVAKAIHNKTFLNRTIAGSCVTRRKDKHAMNWASLILASYTQAKGPDTGYIFDALTFDPLLDEAMTETIRHLENHALYGHENGVCFSVDRF